MKVFNVLEEIKGYQKEIARLKEEYVMLQNSSDEVEEELQNKLDKVRKYIKDRMILEQSFSLDKEQCIELLEMLGEK